jgi:hypothetical protein
LRRHDLLKGLHEVLQPRSYFEIGVSTGLSLGLSRARSVAVDPFFRVTSEIRCDVHLVRASSDEFFARENPFAHLAKPSIDLAFIDGMHLAEYALRDFINTERYCHAASVIVLDDMLPRSDVEAARERSLAAGTGAWAGDVYKVIDTLRKVRPDLIVLELDTTPTGTLVVLLPDPENSDLHAAYDNVVREYVTPDPQDVPEWSLKRTRAIKGEELLESPVWSQVRRARLMPQGRARSALRNAYREAGLVTAREN